MCCQKVECLQKWRQTLDPWSSYVIHERQKQKVEGQIRGSGQLQLSSAQQPSQTLRRIRRILQRVRTCTIIADIVNVKQELSTLGFAAKSLLTFFILALYPLLFPLVSPSFAVITSLLPTSVASLTTLRNQGYFSLLGAFAVLSHISRLKQNLTRIYFFLLPTSIVSTFSLADARFHLISSPRRGRKYIQYWSRHIHKTTAIWALR